MNPGYLAFCNDSVGTIRPVCLCEWMCAICWMACGWCYVCCGWLCCEVSVRNQSSDRNLHARHDIDRWFEYNEAKDSCNECSCNNRYLTAYVAVHSYINQKSRHLPKLHYFTWMWGLSGTVLCCWISSDATEKSAKIIQVASFDSICTPFTGTTCTLHLLCGRTTILCMQHADYLHAAVANSHNRKVPHW